MEFYQEIKLLPTMEFSVNILWSKIYEQLHIKLAELQNNEKEGEKTFLKLNNASKKFLSIDCNFMGTVEEDKKLTEAVRKQVPIVVSFPNSKVSKSISTIAKIIDNNIVNKEEKRVNHLFKNILQLFR